MGRNLTNLFISESFQYLTQISGSELQTGLGQTLTGSLAITSSKAETVYTQQTNANQNHYVAFVATTNDYETLETDNQLVYNPNSNLLTVTASYANIANSASYAVTASFALNAGTTVSTSSLLTTASAVANVITFTKGDGSTFNVTVSQSGSVASASYADFAATAGTANTASYVANAVYTASVVDATTTYTKGNGTTFNTTINNVTSSISSSRAVSSSFASVAATATSASYATQAANATSASFATLAATATSASQAANATSASYAISASQAQNAVSASYYGGTVVSASYAATSSYATNFNVAGTLTALSASITYLTTVFETASVIYSSGSNQFGDASNDVQTLYGTVNILTGPLNVSGSATFYNGITGSLAGTASFATSASQAVSSSRAVSASFATSASQAISSSFAVSASWAPSVASNPFPYTGSADISGSLTVIGDFTTASGSVNLNRTYTYFGGANADSTFVGNNAGQGETGGYENTAFGKNAGKGVGNGGRNTYIGKGAGESTNSTGVTAVGSDAANSQAGNDNVFVGRYAGYVSAGSNNVILGADSGFKNNGDNNILIGKSLAGQFGSTFTANNKVAIGSDSAPEDCLIYGDHEAGGANRFLKVNGNLIVSGSISGPGVIFTNPTGSYNAIGYASQSYSNTSPGTPGADLFVSSSLIFSSNVSASSVRNIAIVGGKNHKAYDIIGGTWAVDSSGIFGGSDHEMKFSGSNNAIIGGQSNDLEAVGLQNSVIVGGQNHRLYATENSVILGGTSIDARTASHRSAFIGGSGGTFDYLQDSAVIASNNTTFVGGTLNNVTVLSSKNISKNAVGTDITSSIVIAAVDGSQSNRNLNKPYTLYSERLQTFNGAEITGSVIITGSLTVSGSVLGNIIGNNTDTYTSSAAVQQIVTLTQAEYNAIGSPDANTFYIISGSAPNATLASNTFTGNQVFSGSVRGAVISGSTTSNTASLDFSTGNFFTLNTNNVLNTQITPTNIQAGQTINLELTFPATASAITFPSFVKQPSGSAYSPSGANTTDILTFIVFNTGSVYLSSVKNLI